MIYTQKSTVIESITFDVELSPAVENTTVQSRYC